MPNRKPPIYLTDYNSNKFKQRRQFGRIMEDFKPEYFDEGREDFEDDGND